MFGNRGIYHNGWYACTTPAAGPWLMGLVKLPDVVNGYKWELYNIAEDYSQANDLAAKMPDKLREMQELFLVEAAKYQVFPLDNDILPRLLAPKPSYIAGRTEFTYARELTGTPNSNAPNILAKSYTITAEIEVPAGGGDGMIVTDGGRFGGYGLYLLKGKPVFTYNFLGLEKFRLEGKEPLTPGKHRLEFDFKYNGPGMAKGGSGVLKVDGTEVATKSIPHTIPAVLTIDETLDIGSDTRTPVDDADYQVPFPFTGKLGKVGFKLGPSELGP
jgi:arylsulfatase